MTGELSFACPNLVRQRLIQDGPTSTLVYDTCTCRTDHVPMIHDLEFDKFIELTGQMNPKQLIVIGIINSNLRQNDFDQSQQSNEYFWPSHSEQPRFTFRTETEGKATQYSERFSWQTFRRCY